MSLRSHHYVLALSAITALFACGRPFFNAPPPTVPIVRAPKSPHAISQIELHRSLCFGHCPYYTVRLSRDGTALYRGLRNVMFLGTYRATVDSVSFDKLATFVLDRHFFDMPEQVGEMIVDHPVTTVRVVADDSTIRTKEVRGVRYAALPFARIVAEIDSLIARLAWSAAADTSESRANAL